MSTIDSNNQYTLDFVLSIKDNYHFNKENISDTLNNFLSLYEKQSSVIEFKKYKKYSKQSQNKLNYNINHTYKKNKNNKNNSSTWRKKELSLKKGENAWISHTLSSNGNNTDEKCYIKYKKIILGNLNKITDKNIDKIISILSNKLIEYNDILTLYILAEELINKIWFDNSFHEQYIKIIKHFSNLEEEWYSNLFLIYSDDKGYHWKYMKYTEEHEKYTSCFKGPFIDISYDSVKNNANTCSNFKTIFLNICQREFSKKLIYIKELEEYMTILNTNTNTNENNNLDEDYEMKIFNLKRKVFGTIEIIGYLYKHSEIKIDIINIININILEHLIKKDINSNNFNEILENMYDNNKLNTQINININNVKNCILIESLIKLWYIIYNKQDKKKYTFRNTQNIVFNTNTTKIYLKLISVAVNMYKWKTKLKFIIQDFYDFIQSVYKTIDVNQIKNNFTINNNKNSNVSIDTIDCLDNKNISEINDDTSSSNLLYTYDENNFYDFKDHVASKISSYSKKTGKNEYEKLYDYIDNLMPGDCQFMGDELYSKYIEELVLIIIMRCFDYNKEEELLIDGLLKRLIDDKLVNNKHVLNTYKLIEEYWDDFIIDFPKMGEYMTSIKSRLDK